MWSITSQNMVLMHSVFSVFSALEATILPGNGFTSFAGQWSVLVEKKLSGIVEVDETYVGGQKSGKRGRGAEGKALVMIAVEHKGELGFGRIRLGRVEDASGGSLTRFIGDNVEAGSTVRTDGWKGYSSLRKKGYEHVAQTEMNEIGDDMLPLAHRVASLMKRWLMGTYQGAVREQHLDYYLDEYTFRFNRRTSASRGKLFYRLVQQAMLVDPVPAKQIVDGTGAKFQQGTENGINHKI